MTEIKRNLIIQDLNEKKRRNYLKKREIFTYFPSFSYNLLESSSSSSSSSLSSLSSSSLNERNHLKLLFEAPNTLTNYLFWKEFYDLKLKSLGLNDEIIEVISYYNNKSIQLNNYSFLKKLINQKNENNNNNNNENDDNDFGSNIIHGFGILKNVNTVNEFKNFNKQEFLNNAGEIIWNAILEDKIKNDPTYLNDFVLLTFADLKEYKFTYWFGYPTFVPEIPFTYYAQPYSIIESLNDELFTSDIDNIPVFGLKKEENRFTRITFQESIDLSNSSNEIIFVVNYGPDTKNHQDLQFTFDQFTLPWHIRNLLAYFSIKRIGYETESSDGKVVKLILLHPSTNKVELSPVLSIFLSYSAFPHGELKIPKIIGWQPNERGKAGPNVLNANAVMNTQSIMEQAVDLNIRLMKWRLWPNVNVEKLSNTKCLLLGAGTLGCAVARTLMGWGVRDITFVDNGKVSFSNPARQSLFEYEDCVNNSFKAIAAANRLRQIFPGMKSFGEVLSIPMPGHPVEDHNKFIETITKLEELIKSHDVVFALTDSREARWLPTVICSAFNKILINAALGFDSYLVMRHGHSVLYPPLNDNVSRLGCYYCMDVSAPGNSQRDRTLDQQCTVTRPGLAQIASGLAVELMVSLLHSEEGQYTSAHDSSKLDNDHDHDSSNGNGNKISIPHQIRGFLSSFIQVQPKSLSFQHCTACSKPIIEQFYPLKDSIRQLDIVLLEKVCSDSTLLQDISGVNDLTAGLDDIDLLENDDF